MRGTSLNVGQTIMNFIQPIIELLRVIAWPIVVLTIVFLFRRDLSGLLLRVSSLRHNATELKFGEELATAADKVAQATDENGAYLSTPEAQKTLSILEISPSSAVIAAWVDFERAAREVSELPLRKNNRPVFIVDILDELVERGRLDSSDADFVHVLLKLRNAVLHAPVDELDRATAEKAIHALLLMTYELRSKV